MVPGSPRVLLGFLEGFGEDSRSGGVVPASLEDVPSNVSGRYVFGAISYGLSLLSPTINPG